MEPQVYSPGAGHAPVSQGLPGRTSLRGEWLDGLRQLELTGRRLAVDPVITGLRGTGKTVLLERLRMDSRAEGFECIAIQATRGQGIWAELTDQLDTLAEQQPGSFWSQALNQMQRITGVQVAGVGVNLTAPPPSAPARRSGHRLAVTLRDLSLAIREARGGRGGLVITVDELQTAPAADLELLGAALHQLNHDDLRAARVAFVGAALPSFDSAVRGPDPNAPLITHPERLFTLHRLPPTLDRAAATLAVVEPAATQAGSWTEEAIGRVIALSDGYPAHLQHLAAATWEMAQTPHINHHHVDAALPRAAVAIETNYLQPRWNRLSDRHQEYIAALGIAGGTASARQMTVLLNRKTASQLSTIRDALIKRGEIYSPAAGQIALAMPLMARYAVAVYPATRDRSSRRDDLATLDELNDRQSGWRTSEAAGLSMPPGGVATLEALRDRLPRSLPGGPREPSPEQ